MRSQALVAFLMICAAINMASAAPGPEGVAGPKGFAQVLCKGLATAVDAMAPSGQPVFLASYRPGPGESEVPLALRTSAFSYDNALAAIALVACGDTARAGRIGDAFLHALASDRTFHDGRIRNAYRAGALSPDQPMLLPGWWDKAAGHWAEDPYQDGTATGNVAWAALALLTLHDATGRAEDLAGVRDMLGWIAANTRAPAGTGFSGGVDGFDPIQTRLTWASTEQNVDIAAAARWYDRVSGDSSTFAGMAMSARQFLDRAFLPAEGCFVLGTTPDGTLADAEHLAIDTQLWPLLLDDASPAWHVALDCADQRFAVDGGFDFDNDRDGLWVEGTAQGALTFRARGLAARSVALLTGLRSELTAQGWLYATRAPQISTGLKIGPHSKTADFFYYRRPHLGATAWAALAAIGWNPFTGRRLQ